MKSVARFSMKHRDLISHMFFLFFSLNFKTCPQKCPNCPCPKSVAQKQSFICLSLSDSHILGVSWSANYDSSSCFWKLYIYIYFFSLSYDNLFSSSSPQVLRFCHYLKKPHYKIKEQWIRGGKNACEAPSLIFKLIYNYVQHCTHTVNGDINTLRWLVMYHNSGVLVL